MLDAITRETIVNLSKQLEGKLLFVGYRAGLEPTAEALEEASFATETLGQNRQHYVGRFSSLFVNRRGEVVLTLFVFDRGRSGEGRYRSFNPAVGTMRTVSVLG